MSCDRVASAAPASGCVQKPFEHDRLLWQSELRVQGAKTPEAVVSIPQGLRVPAIMTVKRRADRLTRTS
jgi:hypothetical protein